MIILNQESVDSFIRPPFLKLPSLWHVYLQTPASIKKKYIGSP